MNLFKSPFNLLSVLSILLSLTSMRTFARESSSFCRLSREASLIMEANALSWTSNKMESHEGVTKFENILTLEKPKRIFKATDPNLGAESRKMWDIYWSTSKGPSHISNKPSDDQPVVVFINVSGANFTAGPKGHFWLDRKSRLWKNSYYFPKGVSSDDLSVEIAKCLKAK